MNISLSLVVLGNLFNLFSYVYTNQICPVLVKDVNSYNAAQRFQNLMNAIGTKKSFQVRFKHNRNLANDEYDYTVTFCGDDGSTAVKQVEVGEKTMSQIIARHSNLSLLVGAEDWLFLQYYYGDEYHTFCSKQKKQAWISIRCEEDGEPSELKVVEEARYLTGKRHKDTLCYYLFEYNHPAACSHTKPKKKLSGGAIFCIILLVLASCYLLFGFIYQRFVAGAKGFEQIPNFSFWKKVGNASADGCDFVCRREEHPTTYKGMADALDIDTSDDEKDDGLLPM